MERMSCQYSRSASAVPSVSTNHVCLSASCTCKRAITCVSATLRVFDKSDPTPHAPNRSNSPDYSRRKHPWVNLSLPSIKWASGMRMWLCALRMCDCREQRGTYKDRWGTRVYQGQYPVSCKLMKCSCSWARTALVASAARGSLTHS